MYSLCMEIYLFLGKISYFTSIIGIDLLSDGHQPLRFD